MKLTAKIVAMFFLASSALLAVGGWLSVQRQSALYRQELADRHRQVALALQPLLNSDLNVTTVRRLFGASYLDEKRVSLRWVWLDRALNVETLPLADATRLRQASPGQVISLPVERNNGTELYCSYYLVATPEGRLGALEMTEPLTRQDIYSREALSGTLLLLLGLVIEAVLIVSLVGVRLVGRPLQALLRKTEQAAAGNLLTPVQIAGQDELSELAGALNRMCESLHSSRQAVLDESEKRIAAVEQLRHANRLKTVGRLGAGMAHELGTPLSVVIGQSSLIADGKVSGEEAQRSAEAIRHEAHRMTQLVQGLLNFARRAPAQKTGCHMAEIVQQTVVLLEPFARRKSATITTHLAPPDGDELQADCAQLQQVVSNLIMNAILSRDSGANVRVSLSQSDHANPEEPNSATVRCIVLEVTDDGSGIAEEHKSHLFEPFFTTRETGEGTGLGLSIVHGIVTDHGGWITVASTPGAGSTFTVYLPLENRKVTA
ncbi:MAG: HAMP domain-containing sensor histidine kinase [Fuerstiella sp.]